MLVYAAHSVKDTLTTLFFCYKFLIVTTFIKRAISSHFFLQTTTFLSSIDLKKNSECSFERPQFSRSENARSIRVCTDIRVCWIVWSLKNWTK